MKPPSYGLSTHNLIQGGLKQSTYKEPTLSVHSRVGHKSESSNEPENPNLVPIGGKPYAPPGMYAFPPPTASHPYHASQPAKIVKKKTKKTKQQKAKEDEQNEIDESILQIKLKQKAKEDEANLLNKLKQQANDDDLRKVIEEKKVKMLDSRPDGIKVEKTSSSIPDNEMCPLCWSMFKDLDELLKHMKSSHMSNMFGCKLCKAVGWSMEILFKHITETHDKSATMSEALHKMKVPESLERINCKMCPPPYQLGQEGLWLCADLTSIKSEVDIHFNYAHNITDQGQIHSKLELACRCCLVTFSAGQKAQWYKHTNSDHGSMEEAKVGVRCEYCGDSVVEAEMVWHLENKHDKDVFLCRICTASDTTCFPFAASLKEMMQHMVMKHGDQFESFYDHMTYPTLLYRSGCTAATCGTDGKFIAPTSERAKNHVTSCHRDVTPAPEFEYFCRCCDKAGQTFKSIEEVDAHVSKRHKQIVKWKQTNGNN